MCCGMFLENTILRGMTEPFYVCVPKIQKQYQHLQLAKLSHKEILHHMLLMYNTLVNRISRFYALITKEKN